ncbi:hypothetical protein KY495_03005 [Massilia sp. PAMC28688]|uniref:STY0301 family protein n=1 Tax=Massilia sp. PAMC28688 TaxID=2861283 RepID=UPI001C638DC4|nr:STY0301 family protein [Massilia sp. PAMC28688]QYF94211.1 hypothetical protein KY495_03005 [Massilia sp. PAMC28688]
MRPYPYAFVLYAIGIAAACCLPGRVAATNLAAECPVRIPAASFTAGKPPAGWTGFVPAPLRLTGAGMMSGPPASLQYLVPDKEGQEMQAYDFPKGDGQRWLWCSYNGGVQLSRRLDDKATHCTIVEKRRDKELLGAAVTCR